MIAAIALAFVAVANAAVFDNIVGAIGLGISAVTTALWVHALDTRIPLRDVRRCRCSGRALVLRELEVAGALLLRSDRKRRTRLRRQLRASVLRRM